MNPPDKPDKEAESSGQVQKRRISWDEFERITGRKRQEPPAPEPPPPDPAVVFAALLEAVQPKPRQKAFGKVIRQRLAPKMPNGLMQAEVSVRLGFKNRGQFGNLLDARNGAWTTERLERLLAALDTDAASLLAALEQAD